MNGLNHLNRLNHSSSSTLLRLWPQLLRQKQELAEPAGPYSNQSWQAQPWDVGGLQWKTAWNDWATILQVNYLFPVSTLLFHWTRSKKVSSSGDVWSLWADFSSFSSPQSFFVLIHILEPPVLVRLVGGFLKWGYLQIIHLNRIFHSKPSSYRDPSSMEAPSKNSWTGHVSWTTSTAWTTTMVQRLPRSSRTEISICICICICICTCICICICTCICKCIRICVCVYVSVYVCVYIYIHI